MNDNDSKDKFTYETKEEYTFKLDQFEGPLDLLLHLIKEAKIDIKDIFISKITEQYLKYMENISALDVEKAGEFVEMAATLLEIKSKQLLPKPELVQDNEVDEEQLLIRRLEEYKLFKEQSEKLKKVEDVDRFFKEPDSSVGEVKFELGELSFNGLLSAFSKMMQRITEKAELPQPKTILKERFTVAQKISQIKDNLISKKKLKFSELFDDAQDKMEVINTFLALLELLKLQIIVASQNSTFGEIMIEKYKGDNNGKL